MIIEELTKEILFNCINNKNKEELLYIFDNFNNVDIAELLDEYEDINGFLFVFKIAPNAYSAEVFAYLSNDVQENIINAISGDQLESLIEYAYNDDIVDVVQELPSNLVTKVLEAAPKERRVVLNQLLNYKEDSAGAIMTTEFVMLRENDDIDLALSKLKKAAKRVESLSNLFVVDEKRFLKGTITLKDLFTLEDKKIVKDIMETDFISCNVNTDQEDVANEFKKYDISSMPVVNSEGCLIGIITVDDIIDVIEEETTEDIHKMASITPLEEEYLRTSPWEIAKKGVLWLVMLMLLGTFTSLIMSSFDNALAIIPCLSFFVPMLIDTAGNAGNQSSALIIRGIALSEVETKDYLRVVGKELTASLIVGGVVSIANFLWILLITSIGIVDISASSLPPLILAALVAISMFTSIVVSKFLGSSLPILCKVFKIDPAMLAGPMVTTLVDASSLIIYFLIAKLLFKLF